MSLLKLASSRAAAPPLAPLHQGRWRCLLLALLLPIGGCREDEPVPEHVAQQRARQRSAEERLRARQRVEKSDAALPGETWPQPVQLAYLTLLATSPAETREAARSLAALGLQAVPALREVAVNPAASQQKRELASLLLAELYLMRPDDLATLARERRFAIAQRAALESLVRLGRPAGEAALAPVEAELRSRRDSAMLQFLAAARRREKAPWNYRRDQLETLDRLVQARSATELKVALGWVKDLSLQAGLERILTVAVVPLPSQLILAAHLASIAAREPRRLRELARASHPPLLRLAAGRALVESSSREDRRLIERLAADPEDPLAPALRKLQERAASRPTR